MAGRWMSLKIVTDPDGLNRGLTDGEGDVEAWCPKRRLRHQRVRMFSHEGPEIESAG